MKIKATLFISILCICIAKAQIPGYVPSNGLQGYWPFTGNANDLGVNAYNGTVNGATLSPDRFGNLNSAYSFNGSTSFILTTSPGILGSNARAVSFWAKTTSTNAMSAVGWGNDLQATRFDCYFNYAGTGATFDGAYGAITYSAPGASDNAWHHYVYQFNGTLISQVEIYKDAILLNQIVSTYNATNILNTQPNYNVYFGKIPYPANPSYFDGTLDDIGIWNRKLTICEINQLYTSSMPSFSITSTNSISCPGQPVVLTASGAITYTWSNALNTSTITVSPGITATYTLTGTNINGCNGTASITQPVVICDGIIESTFGFGEARGLVYPNPSHGVFVINTAAPALIEIYNCQGSLIYYGKSNNTMIEVDLSEQPLGIYFIKISTGNFTQFEKILRN